MKKEPAAIGACLFLLAVPETIEEMKSGWGTKPPDCDGVLFPVKRFARESPLWIAVQLGSEAPALDVLFVSGSVVNTIATIRQGCFQGYGDLVIELESGVCMEKGIEVGDSIAWELVAGAERGC